MMSFTAPPDCIRLAQLMAELRQADPYEWQGPPELGYFGGDAMIIDYAAWVHGHVRLVRDTLPELDGGPPRPGA